MPAQQFEVDRRAAIFQEIARENRLTGATVGIPRADQRGFLLPGIHLATRAEFEKRFAWNRRRRRLLRGLYRQMDVLKAAGCRRVFIAGSFVTTKWFPKDFDGCFDAGDVDKDKLDKLDSRFWNADEVSLEEEDGGRLETSLFLPMIGATMIEFFQYDDRHGGRKGIVMIEL